MSTWSEESLTNPRAARDALDGGGTIHGFRADSLRSTIASGDPLQNAMSEFARRRTKPDAMSAQPRFTRASRSRMPNVMNFAGAVAVACVVALMFVRLFPGERDLLQSFAAAVPPAPSLREAGAVTGREPAREIDAASGGAMSQEQSERVLQQLVQWRQKVVVTEKQ